MAGITDILTQGMGEEAGKAFGADIGGSINKGAALAQSIENMKAQREELEQKKQELQMQKATRILDAVEKGSQFKDKAAQNLYFKNYVPGMIKAFKMQDLFPDELMSYVQQSEDVRNKLIGLRLDIQDKIQSGQLKGAAIFQYAKDRLSPEELPLLDTDSLLEQQKFAASEGGKFDRAQFIAGASAAKQEREIKSTGEKEVARETGKEYVAYMANGGRASISSSIRRLEDAANALETGNVKTGGVTTTIPGFRSDSVQVMLNPKMVEMRTEAQSALNNVLRQTLGAAFTKDEGERVLNQVWDDKQSPSVNAKKIREKLVELRSNVADKEALFKRYGHPVPSERGAAEAWLKSKKIQAASLDETEYQKFISGAADKLGISIEDVRKILGK